ncbi:hypothetical protein HYFRA_00012189 [Hymenoscyphus fraxineus]|uniref:VOC domain-containing protein n=1 Tax=Hymenoscyphus fraxineus TaxID=746836 RepID=A0A9N9PLZ7_9HELO|nr:hypothetical protein HYFRA_00012189 [Hymenoscyphus fraxineus]
MTINHLFLMVPSIHASTLRTFYRQALRPLSYTELIVASETYIGYGSDYPYFWLKPYASNASTAAPVPTHIAFDAPSQPAVDEFYKAALEAGGTDNGAPGIRTEYGRQPYYAAYVKDVLGNNIEAVHVPK